jgi:Ig-like domain from next to BRCA1 gene
MLPFPEVETHTSTASKIPFGSCTDGLVFMGDLTYPDRTKVKPGQVLEKQWKVRNNGTCDWGPDYRVRWVGGAPLSSVQEIALYPAVSGSEAVITVLLTAPLTIGESISNWRAFSPTGTAFGDILFIDIIV